MHARTSSFVIFTAVCSKAINYEHRLTIDLLRFALKIGHHQERCIDKRGLQSMWDTLNGLLTDEYM